MKENKYKYESPDERTERFMRLVEAEERKRLKEEYEAERRKDQEVLAKRMGYEHRREVEMDAEWGEEL